MAVKRHKQSKSRKRRIHRAVRGGPFRLRKKTEPAASNPPAGDTMPHHNHAGILRFEAENLHLPEALAEAGETESNSLVVIVITTLAIAFIAIIAWFVSQMPGK